MVNASTVLCFSTGLACALAASPFDQSNYPAERILRRDVAIIGGGASGTYGAIKLKDMGKSVVVVEKQDHFGGHVNTYTDPATGLALDYGTQSFENTAIANDFFARFNVRTIPLSGSNFSSPVYADFRTGQVLEHFMSSFNFSAYLAQLDRYQTEPWDLPDPIPEDLLLPFRDLVVKYSLQDLAYTISSFSWGSGNILDLLTLYVFQTFNRVLLQELMPGASGFTTNNNSELYAKAQAELGSDALVNSIVVSGNRSNNENAGVRLVVQTPTGRKLIMASQVLISAPITLDNMRPFGLDTRECKIFEQIGITAYYTALVANTGLPAGVRYSNAAVNTTYNIPRLPAAYVVSPTTKDADTFYVWYGSPNPLPEQQVRADMIRTIQSLSHSSATPKFLGFASHTPFLQTVSASAIRAGFYDDLNNLQGYRNTWYTGNSLSHSGTPGLWNFTGLLLPRIVSAVDKSRRPRQLI